MTTAGAELLALKRLEAVCDKYVSHGCPRTDYEQGQVHAAMAIRSCVIAESAALTRAVQPAADGGAMERAVKQAVNASYNYDSNVSKFDPECFLKMLRDAGYVITLAAHPVPAADAEVEAVAKACDDHARALGDCQFGDDFKQAATILRRLAAERGELCAKQTEIMQNACDAAHERDVARAALQAAPTEGSENGDYPPDKK